MLYWDVRVKEVENRTIDNSVNIIGENNVDVLANLTVNLIVN